MIIELKPDLTADTVSEIAQSLNASRVRSNGHHILVTPWQHQRLESRWMPYVANHTVTTSDIQLASLKYQAERRAVSLGDGHVLGGAARQTWMISGPCAVESEAQVMESARLVKESGGRLFRAGAFKPRTSPYTFQGLGHEGLALLREVRRRYDLKIVTEVRDSTHLQDVIDTADIIQIGAKAMYDYAILEACGEARKPVLLKRGYGARLHEFVQVAEFMLMRGNEEVMLCERGIRTFESATRFTLDLCGVAFLKHETNLPVIVDPSHAMGIAYGVPDLALAAMAMGVDGLLIEAHPNPKEAWSDATQQIPTSELKGLRQRLTQVGAAVGYTLM